MKDMSKLFLYWSMKVNIELLEFRFVLFLREGDLPLYVQVNDEIFDYAFMFNQTHYSRWISILVKDMVELIWKHPDIYNRMITLFADVAVFFRHENLKESPALFDQGKLRLGTKSDILSFRSSSNSAYRATHKPHFAA